MENNLGSGIDVVKLYILPWGINVVSALAIYIIGRWLSKLLTRVSKTLMEKSRIDESLRNFLGNLIYAALTVVVIIAAIGQLGIDTTSIIAVFAAAGLAAGLAMKDSLSNFAAGVMLVVFKPFKLGDVITAAGETGVVESINIVNTLLRTGDNQEIVIPNSQIFANTIKKKHARDTRRIDLVIGIGYSDSIPKAKMLLDDILASEPNVLKDPAPAVLVMELGESSVNLAVRPWVKTANYWTVRSDLLQAIKESFHNNGISIPFPQRDLHIVDAPKSANVA
jgi:small conductance mechanosensitive channel